MRDRRPGAYSFILDGWRPRPTPEIGELLVKRRETCQLCGRTMVNIYEDGNSWKCRRCMDGGPKKGEKK